MFCPECKNGTMRTPGSDKRGKDKLGIYRYRKCNDCDFTMETRELFDIMLTGDCAKVHQCMADVCPVCLGDTVVWSTYNVFARVCFGAAGYAKNAGPSFGQRKVSIKLGY